METDKIKELIRLMKDNDLKVLRLEDENTKLYIEAHSKQTVHKPVQTNAAVPQATATDAPIQTTLESDLIEVRANQIGIFYTQPDEDSTDTFVKVGDKVEAGDQIGLIEIMKLFNEVRVEHSGIVEEILVANGEPVEFDQVLMLLRPEEE